jgi:hypothetical protein
LGVLARSKTANQNWWLPTLITFGERQMISDRTTDIPVCQNARRTRMSVVHLGTFYLPLAFALETHMGSSWL